MTNRMAVLVDPAAITTVLDTLTARVDAAERALTVARARARSYRAHNGSHPAVLLKHAGDREAALARLDEARFALRAVMDALGLA